MKKIFYEWNESVNIDEFEEGVLLSVLDSEKVVCLEKREYNLLNIVRENEFQEMVELLIQQYSGDDIKDDMEEFCRSLCDCGILTKVVIE